MHLVQFLKALWAITILILELAIAAPQGQYRNGLSKRTWVDSCDSSAQATLLQAVEEMKTMLASAIDRTATLQTFLEDPPAHITSQGMLLQSTYYTFESIFGKLEYGSGSSQNAESIARVGTILDLASTMKTSLVNINSNENLEIYCSDSWLVSEDPEGDISLINPFLYWDNRDSRTMAYAEDFSQVNGICRDADATHYAFVTPYMSSKRTTSGQTTVLTLCQHRVSEWTSLYQNGETMSAASNTLYADGTRNIDFFQGYTMSTAIMHEFTHAPAIVGANILLDQPCNLGGATVSAYGWKCITSLAATPSMAVANADSFSFYVTAMFLSLNDWSTGLSIQIPADTAPDYTDGLASMMSKLQI